MWITLRCDDGDGWQMRGVYEQRMSCWCGKGCVLRMGRWPIGWCSWVELSHKNVGWCVKGYVAVVTVLKYFVRC